MKVYLGTDHRGFKLAEEISVWLMENNVAGVNVGDEKLDPKDDYVDFAVDVARRVSQIINNGHDDTRGIVFCGSGVGVDIVANKIKNIRCGLAISKEQIEEARRDDNINVLAIAADFTDEIKTKEIVKVFLETPFSSEERHVRRLSKISALE